LSTHIYLNQRGFSIVFSPEMTANRGFWDDTYGHLEGDAVLAGIGVIIRDMIRENDTGCRYGGEEFVVILPDVEKERAFEISERIRKKIFNQFASDSRGSVTISAGIAALQPGDDPESFFSRADHAMYLAKRSGRNRTIISNPESIN
jgi:diguanylate cyclase (GGDEF)-like protein